MATGFPLPLWGSAGGPYLVQGAGCVPGTYSHMYPAPAPDAAPPGAAPRTFWLISPSDQLSAYHVPMGSYFLGGGVPNATVFAPNAAYALPPGNPPSYGHVYNQPTGPAYHVGMGPNNMQDQAPGFGFGASQQWIGLVGGAATAQAPAASAQPAAAPRLRRELQSDVGGAWDDGDTPRFKHRAFPIRAASMKRAAATSAAAAPAPAPSAAKRIRTASGELSGARAFSQCPSAGPRETSVGSEAEAENAGLKGLVPGMAMQRRLAVRLDGPRESYMRCLDYRTFDSVLSLGCDIAWALFPDPRVVELDPMMVVLVDSEGREWPCRYHALVSKHSYVLRSGWRQFVEANKVAKSDSVVLSRDAGLDSLGHSRVAIQVLRRKPPKQPRVATAGPEAAAPSTEPEPTHSPAGAVRLVTEEA